jgi:hypothetical protein
MTQIPNDNRAKAFGSAFAIQDPETCKILSEPIYISDINSSDVIDEYLNLYDNWISSTKTNTFIGLG